MGRRFSLNVFEIGANLGGRENKVFPPFDNANSPLWHWKQFEEIIHYICKIVTGFFYFEHKVSAKGLDKFKHFVHSAKAATRRLRALHVFNISLLWGDLTKVITMNLKKGKIADEIEAGKSRIRGPTTRIQIFPTYFC